MGIWNSLLVRLGLRSPEYERYRADRMRILSKKYRDLNNPLFRGSPKDYQEILEAIESAATKGETHVSLKIHISDEIRENLELLGYNIEDVHFNVPENTEGALVLSNQLYTQWYIRGIKILF